MKKGSLAWFTTSWLEELHLPTAHGSDLRNDWLFPEGWWEGEEKGEVRRKLQLENRLVRAGRVSVGIKETGVVLSD